MTNPSQLIKTIENALADEANEAARRDAANACRQLLAALESKPGERLATIVPLPGSVPPGVPQPPVQASVNPGLLLEGLIARLKGELPNEDEPEVAERELRIPFVPIPGSEGA